MRSMIVVKANRDSEAGVMPEDELVAEMAKRTVPAADSCATMAARRNR